MMKLRLATASAPIDTISRQHVEPRQPIRGLAELHHERVAGLLRDEVIEVDIPARVTTSGQGVGAMSVSTRRRNGRGAGRRAVPRGMARAVAAPRLRQIA